MVNVCITRDETGFIRHLSIKGHAGYAKTGSDIVCAAVSVTAYTAAGALGDIAGLKNCFVEKDGYMLISMPEDITEQQRYIADIILETTVIGLKQIEMSYRRYVTVLDEEV